MGTYLSTPVTEKCQESGEFTSTANNNRPLKWGVVDMQGWRKSMEDAHVAVTDATIPSRQMDDSPDTLTTKYHNAKVFGVFDGHGGPEVARFCSLYMVSVLQQQPTWKYIPPCKTSTSSNNQDNTTHECNNDDINNSSIGDALISAFHALDRMIDDPHRRDELVRLRGNKPEPGERRHAVSIPPEAFNVDYAKTNSEQNPSATGGSVHVSAATSNLSALLHEISEEQATSSTNDNDQNAAQASSSNCKHNELENTNFFDSADLDEIKAETTTDTDSTPAESSGESNNNDTTPDPYQEGIDTKETSPNSNDDDTAITLSTMVSEDSVMIDNTSATTPDGSSDPSITETNNVKSIDDPADNTNSLLDRSTDDDDDDDDCFEDADSVEAVGMEEAAAERNSSNNDDDDENDVFDDVMVEVNETAEIEGLVELNEELVLETGIQLQDNSRANSNITTDSEREQANSSQQITPQQLTTEGKLSIIFQRLLNISGPPLQVSLQESGGQGGGDSNSNAQRTTLTTSTSPRSVLFSSTTPASVVRNGQMFCNLQDHAIHAGATAIVAVIVGDTLTVANAGDSRAVLCRGISAIPLSADHKPMHDRELNRIRNAGGFVNSFGRVNGNLNLSRSIGDLKYKQVGGLKPEQQIITAHPDIRHIQLTNEDEFILLGCDGIWDCLSNESAVEYVRERIDSKALNEIGIEMLNNIISDDPRMTQGIGGDNMTIMIIDLQPQNRQVNNMSNST